MRTVKQDKRINKYEICKDCENKNKLCISCTWLVGQAKPTRYMRKS